jgi:hypothetical protein
VCKLALAALALPAGWKLIGMGTFDRIAKKD